jgi:hypothetical protein
VEVLVRGLMAIVILGAIVLIAIRAHRKPPGLRLGSFFLGVFLLGLGLWIAATLGPLVPLLNRIDPLVSALLQVEHPAETLTASAFLGLLGLLALRGIEHLSRARPES